MPAENLMPSQQNSKRSYPLIWAIVPAAGSGQRMGVSTAKQYLEIEGRAIVEISVTLLLDNSKIQEVVVCTSTSDSVWPTLEIAKDDRVRHVIGGASRAESVINGIESLAKHAHTDDWVLVHDAARPCLDPKLLQTLLDELQDHEVGGLLAVPAKDTLKLANSTPSNDPKSVAKTLDRSQIWQAQTPQMFRFGLLRDALKKGFNSSQEITDEASAMELAGYAPRLVQSDARNLKITTPEDLQLAKFLLAND